MRLQQEIPLHSVENARELGGYLVADGREIKRGLLLRTAKLNDISDEDIRTLSEVYRLEHIVDLRMAMELPGADDPVIGTAQYHHLDVIDLSSFMPENTRGVDTSVLDPLQVAQLTIQTGLQNENMYIGFLAAETGKKAFSGFFRILLSADPDRAVLWHCTSGKDRTGIAAMLLLSALGADESLILSDYLLTNTYNAQKIAAAKRLLKEKGQDDAFIEQAILVYEAVDERYLRNAIAFLKQEYGSVGGYIRDVLNITKEEVGLLKEKYLQ